MSGESAIQPRRGIDSGTLQRLLAERAEDLQHYLQLRIPPDLRRVISAEDILQEVWLAAFRGVGTLRSSAPRVFENWLLTITQHKLIDAIKSAQRAKRGGRNRQVQPVRDRDSSLADLLVQVASAGKTPSRDASSKEAVRALQIALCSLPADRQRAIRMWYLDGRSREQIAASMNRTRAAVNSLLFHGMRQLRERLGDPQRFFSDVRSSEDAPTVSRPPV